MIGSREDEHYYKALKLLQNFKKDNFNLGHKLHIIYSPLHGCGITTIPKALNSWGFTSISYVKEQKFLDPSFSSLSFFKSRA